MWRKLYRKARETTQKTVQKTARKTLEKTSRETFEKTMKRTKHETTKRTRKGRGGETGVTGGGRQSEERRACFVAAFSTRGTLLEYIRRVRPANRLYGAWPEA